MMTPSSSSRFKMNVISSTVRCADSLRPLRLLIKQRNATLDLETMKYTKAAIVVKVALPFRSFNQDGYVWHDHTTLYNM